jgi:hypothetical protein
VTPVVVNTVAEKPTPRRTKGAFAFPVRMNGSPMAPKFLGSTEGHATRFASRKSVVGLLLTRRMVAAHVDVGGPKSAGVDFVFRHGLCRVGSAKERRGEGVVVCGART